MIVCPSQNSTKNACHVVPPKLTELRIQSKGLLSAGFIRPAKAPYEAQVFLRKEENGKLRLGVDNRVLKEALREGSTLGFVDVIQPIEAHVDAFDYALGNVLM